MKIRLICDMYSSLETEVAEKRYKELIESNVDYIGKEVYVKIDRPIGSRPIKDHPEFEYKLNYGYVPNTVSGDGEELDCYVVGIDKPIEECTGRCIAIIQRINEDDDKLIIAVDNKEYTSYEIEKLTYFSEEHHKSFIYMK